MKFLSFVINLCISFSQFFLNILPLNISNGREQRSNLEKYVSKLSPNIPTTGYRPSLKEQTCYVIFLAWGFYSFLLEYDIVWTD